jgi:hypothetical protein
VIPSGDVITRLLPVEATATNNSPPEGPPQATLCQELSEADVRIVHTVPLGDVITRLPAPLAEDATATNN